MSATGVTFVFNPNTTPPSEQVNVNFAALARCLLLVGAGESTPAQLTSDQNNFATVDSNGNLISVMRLSSDASRTITGLADGELGRFLFLINVGSNDIIIANQSGSSTAANRIITGTSANITMGADDSMILYYDSTTTRWRTINFSNALWG